MDWVLWGYRQIYWLRRALIKQFCPEENNYPKVQVHSDNLPWFWIGIQYEDGTTVSVTDTINREINYGVRVTPRFLSKATGLIHGTWKYVDVKTLEEKDFPSEGFIIEDAADNSSVSVSDTE